MSSYYPLSGSSKSLPVTANMIKEKKQDQRKEGSWWWSSKKSVKPVFRQQTEAEKAQEFYQKTGIIWNGSVESSVIHSLF